MTTLNTNNVFFSLNMFFAVVELTNAPAAESDITLRADMIQHLSVTQLVQIAKSMNPELKVNNKQSREIILAAIEAEMVNYNVRTIANKAASGTTKSICWDAFATIDMSNKTEGRAMVEKLVAEHGFSKAVVQSYASDFRKAHA